MHYPMEMHWVHSSADDPDDKVVIALFVRESSAFGSVPSWFANARWDEIPTSEGERLADSGLSLNIAELFASAALGDGGIPVTHYVGSLTTPPCTEGVRWFLFSSLGMQLSADQIETFTAIFGDNSRPTQDASGRTIHYDPIFEADN